MVSLFVFSHLFNQTSADLTEQRKSSVFIFWLHIDGVFFFEHYKEILL